MYLKIFIIISSSKDWKKYIFNLVPDKIYAKWRKKSRVIQKTWKKNFQLIFLILCWKSGLYMSIFVPLHFIRLISLFFFWITKNFYDAKTSPNFFVLSSFFFYQIWNLSGKFLINSRERKISFFFVSNKNFERSGGLMGWNIKNDDRYKKGRLQWLH